MTKVGAPLTVYKCLMKAQCPGGEPGSCSTNRDTSAIACGMCVDGAYETEEGCVTCSGGDASPFYLLGPVAVAGVVGLTISVNRSVYQQSSASITLVILIGIMFTSFQVVSVYSQM